MLDQPDQPELNLVMPPRFDGRNGEWTAERVELLKELWADGLTGSQIAAELGGITKSSVIGKIHRLGLSGRKPGTKPGSKHPHVGVKRKQSSAAPRLRIPRPMPEKIKVRRVGYFDGKFAEMDAIEFALPPSLPAADIPIGQRKTFLELGNAHCRYAYGDVGESNFFFCGAEEADVSAGRPYCAFHARVCFNKPRDVSPEESEIRRRIAIRNYKKRAA